METNVNVVQCFVSEERSLSKSIIHGPLRKRTFRKKKLQEWKLLALIQSSNEQEDISSYLGAKKILNIKSN